MRAEGVPVSTGYETPVYKHPVFQEDWKARDYTPFAWTDAAQDYRSLHLPKVEQYCKERLSISQRALLTSETRMRDMSRAFVKVRENADKLREWERSNHS